jgi:hypothetical protein
MTGQLYAYTDQNYLTELGLPSDALEAFLLVYRSATGETGLNRDLVARRLVTDILSDSITINATGKVSRFEPDSALGDYFARVLSSKKITIHAPTAEIYSQANLLSEHVKDVALSVTYARYGKEKAIAPMPELGKLFGGQEEFQQALLWLLSHSSRICVWNRFTEYGTHPTFIALRKDQYRAIVEEKCKHLGISFLSVLDEGELPCW